MSVRTGVFAAAVFGLVLSVAVSVTGQGQQPPAPPPTEGHGDPQAPPSAPGPAQAPRPQQPRSPAVARFPAHQRALDEALVERGRGVYSGLCGACHGVDARGGQLGGPNLLRSQLVLNDDRGELIIPVVKNGRPGTAMVAMDLPEDDIRAISEFLHSLQAQGSMQGGPPPGPPVELDILVGDAKAGASYFAAKCASCHSASGDLQGIASRVANPKALQNLWVSGGRGGRFAPAGGPAITATVTLPSGETVQGRLVRLDDFLVTVRLEDGTTRTLRRHGDTPRVEVDDPLDGHRDLLAVYTDTDMHNVTAYLATLK